MPSFTNCMYIYIYMYIQYACACMHTYMCMYAYTNMYACIHVFMHYCDFLIAGVYTQRIIDRIEFNKLTVCLTCGSYQCGFCPDYASGHSTTASTCLVILSLLILCVHAYRK